ncbi:TAXI family TRAP transporter solute-binding subunit [Oceanobacillus bengalensis]|uniref:TAXI family TRAP transporter solute-binding subunit n=1 Tax=Oceanobacillus bengalensis TaxID=1435466 RepID=A0A494YX15_9BACI|nr:TAXI family TRAP transporter solute-binding subunit [Oceanobacillus bengalensis]RKQ14758.1 TAXI family TRAP transporter solute-binding subunit [Oceanobacillus bengalensis]
MRKLLAPILIVVAIVLAACGGGEEGSGGTKYLTIATASSGGTYYPIGVGLGNLWTEHIDGMNATGQSSAGSVENIDLLRNGEADMAILQGLIGAQAVGGTGNFEGNAYEDLRSISMLWGNVEHFVLMNDKVETGTIEDIAGNTFSVGPQASGTEQSTLIMMEGVGLTKDDITPEYLGYDDAVSAMRDGRLDGGSTPGGTPVSAIMDMYASGVDARVLDITDEQLESINSIYNTWYRFVIPSETYPGQEEDINTIAMPNFLGVPADLDEDMVYELTKTMYENLDQVHEIHNSAKEVLLETALDGLPAPLHVGAYKYFEEQGLEIPEELIPEEAK